MPSLAQTNKCTWLKLSKFLYPSDSRYTTVNDNRNPRYQSIQKKQNLPLLPSKPLQDPECWQLSCWKVVLFYQSTVQSSMVTIHSRQFYQQHNCPARSTHFWIFMSTHCLCSWLQYHKKFFFFLSICSSIFHNEMPGCWGQFALFQYSLPEEGDHRVTCKAL